MAVSPTPPSISVLPPAPLPTDAEAVFDAKAGVRLTAEEVMITEQNAALAWQAGSMAETKAYKDAAATSAGNAASSASSAASTGAAAVSASQAARDAAAASALSAQVSAAAAGSAAGLPSLAGNGGKVLGVNAGETGVGWAESLPALSGNAGKTLMVNAAGTAAVWVALGRLYVVDQKTGGTSGGSSTAFTGAYSVRDINTVVSNGITGSSLSGNQVTLPAGKYRIYASAPAANVGTHKARLYNITSSSVIAEGTNTSAGSGTSSRAEVRTEITLSSSATIRIEHRVTSSGGVMGSADSFGGVETYSELLGKLRSTCRNRAVS